MNREFIQPVSMRVTQQQWLSDLKDNLVSMGYSFMITPWGFEKCNILVNGNLNHIGCLYVWEDERKNANDRFFIDHYNPELFLAVAAMSKKGIHPGEMVKIGNNPKLLKVIEINEVPGTTNVKLSDGKAGVYVIDIGYLVKATLEEIIKHFTQDTPLEKQKLVSVWASGKMPSYPTFDVRQFNIAEGAPVGTAISHDAKPTRGVTPKKLWTEKRFIELGLAIGERVGESMDIPVEWIEEYNELKSQMQPSCK